MRGGDMPGAGDSIGSAFMTAIAQPIFRPSLIRVFFLMLAISLPTAVCPAFGQPSSPSAESQGAALQIESISNAVSLLDRLSKDETVDDQALASSRVKLDGLDRELQEVKADVSRRLGEINALIEQLGPAPGDGQSETASVAQERELLAETKAQLVIVNSKAEETADLISATIDHIAARRSAAFAAELFRRAPIDLQLFQDGYTAAVSEFASRYSLVSSWLSFVLRTKPVEFTFSTVGALFLALGLLLGFRHVFSSLLFRNPENLQPSFFAKIVIGFWSAILPSAIFAVFLAVTFGLYNYFGIFTPAIAKIGAALFLVLAGIFFFYNLSRAILAPAHPNWRLIAVHDSAAPKLLFLTTAMALVYAMDVFLSRLNEIMSAPLPLTIVKSLLASVLFGGLIVAIALVRGGIAKDDGRAVGWPRWISIPLFLTGVAIIAAALAGNIGLARFSAQQIVVTGAILITMYIGVTAGRQIGSEGLLAQSRLGQLMRDRLALGAQTIEQLGIVAGTLFIILVLLVGTPLILLQWGSQPEDIALWFGKAFSGFQIGAVRISFSGLLFGILIFSIGLVVTRLIQRWLSASVLSRSNIDSGVRDSIRTGIGYTGFALAALVAVIAAGIDLSSLAIVAGALSIGIGFGLQNIVSNFVSGLILLVERPIKVGDWIETGTTTGFVKKISVRATEIETFQRQTVIVPNSELINSVVGNWTHKYRGGRIDIPVGVAYGSDVRKVSEILMGIAAEHKLILKNPEPFVLFQGFGESSLDFELRFHISEILKLPVVATEVRFAIVEAFEQNGIEIPFPQRDLHVRTGSLGAPPEPGQT